MIAMKAAMPTSNARNSQIHTFRVEDTRGRDLCTARRPDVGPFMSFFGATDLLLHRAQRSKPRPTATTAAKVAPTPVPVFSAFVQPVNASALMFADCVGDGKTMLDVTNMAVLDGNSPGSGGSPSPWADIFDLP